MSFGFIGNFLQEIKDLAAGPHVNRMNTDRSGTWGVLDSGITLRNVPGGLLSCQLSVGGFCSSVALTVIYSIPSAAHVVNP